MQIYVVELTNIQSIENTFSQHIQNIFVFSYNIEH